MSLEGTGRTVAIVGSTLGGIAALLAITNNCDKVETFLDWFYPLPLLILTLCALVLMTVLFLRERQRKPSQVEVRIEQRQRHAFEVRSRAAY